MSHNQTIDGVPRELLEVFAGPRNNTPEQMRKAMDELRALLDAPAVVSDVVNWKAVANEQMGIIQGLKEDNEKLAGGRARLSTELETLRPAYKSVLAQLDAAQPQGEPVAWCVDREEPGRLGGYCSAAMKVNGTGFESHTKPLYAEQPAPVAVATLVDPERERLMEIVQQYPNVDPLKYDAAVRKLRK